MTTDSVTTKQTLCDHNGHMDMFVTTMMARGQQQVQHVPAGAWSRCTRATRATTARRTAQPFKSSCPAARRGKQRLTTHCTASLWQLRQRPSTRLIRTGLDEPRRARCRKKASIEFSIPNAFAQSMLSIVSFAFAINETVRLVDVTRPGRQYPFVMRHLDIVTTLMLAVHSHRQRRPSTSPEAHAETLKASMHTTAETEGPLSGTLKRVRMPDHNSRNASNRLPRSTP